MKTSFVIIAILALLSLPGCAAFNGVKGSATVTHEPSNVSVTVGYGK